MREILARLEATLSVPSEWVQRSVADVLPPLVGSLTEDERRALMERLLAALTGGLTRAMCTKATASAAARQRMAATTLTFELHPKRA